MSDGSTAVAQVPASSGAPAGLNGSGQAKAPTGRKKAEKRPSDAQPAPNVIKEQLEQAASPPAPRQVQKPNSKRTTKRRVQLDFSPTASHPFQVETVALGSEFSNKLYKDHFGSAQISLYNLMVFLPIRLNQSNLKPQVADAFLDGLEELIEDRIETLRKSLGKALTRAEAVARSTGLKTNVDGYFAGESYTMKIATPQIGSLLGVLKLFDQYIAVVDAIWLNGFMKRRERVIQISEQRNEIVRAIRNFMHLYNETNRRMRADGFEAGALASLLRPVADEHLPERLSAEDEAAGRALTGQAEPVAETEEAVDPS